MKIRNSSPCLDCPDRPPDRGCGEMRFTCEKFLAWNEEWQAKKDAIYGEQQKERILNGFTVANVRRTNKILKRR